MYRRTFFKKKKKQKKHLLQPSVKGKLYHCINAKKWEMMENLTTIKTIHPLASDLSIKLNVSAYEYSYRSDVIFAVVVEACF